MGLHYDGEPSIYDTIENCLNRIKIAYRLAIQNRARFAVKNPVNNNENFTDGWTAAHYDHFYSFIETLHDEWNILKNRFEVSGRHFVELFGEGVYKDSLQQQILQLSKHSKTPIAKANGLIIGGGAFTDDMGQVGAHQGYKNTSHHNYGD
jgi:hypothetical protein